MCVAPLHQAEDEIVRLKASEEALDKLMSEYHSHIEKVFLYTLHQRGSGGRGCRVCGACSNAQNKREQGREDKCQSDKDR